jgi:glutamine amidotransferase
MSKPEVGIIDYGMGNLLSVSRAVERCGGIPKIVGTPEELASMSRLILPGVGAFRDAIAELRGRRLDSALESYAQSGRPLLGICLGMQLLFTQSEEFGLHRGLGLIEGEVKAIPRTKADGTPHKIPHIGWNPLVAKAAWGTTPLTRELPSARAMYFVHSFTAHPADVGVRLADADYNGRVISAVVARDSIFGFQFHPEKSGPAGLALLKSFLRI